MNNRTLLSRQIIYLFAVIFIACSRGPAESAESILQTVEQRYKELDSFEIEGTITSQLVSGPENDITEIPLYIAFENPGKIRIEIESAQLTMTMVSDGNTTWTYLPGSGQYTIRRASPLQTPGKKQINPAEDLLNAGEQLVRTYENITDGLRTARIREEKKIELNGETRTVYEILAIYEKSPRMEEVSMSPTVYWIEKERFLVLKEEMTMEMPVPEQNRIVSMHQKKEIRKADITPVFDRHQFIFDIPENAELVDGLEIFGMQPRDEWEGAMAEPFTLTSLEGKTYDLSELKGNVVLLDFWATWCGPCREAHPHIEKLHREYKEKGLIVLGINSEPEETVEKYMRENGYTFVNLKDTEHSVGGKYKVSVIPAVFIIDREGVVAAHMTGYRSEDQLRRALNKAGL